jgi:hypothetical protein
MHPDQSIIVSGVPQGAYARALVETEKQYALYLHHSTHRKYEDFVTGYIPAPGHYQVDLTLKIARGRFRAEWIDPASGKVMKIEHFIHDGGDKVLSSPPYTVDLALRINRDREKQQ